MSIDERSPIAEHRADRAGGISAAYDDLDAWLIGDEAELPETLADLDAVERTLRAIAWRRRKVAQAEMVALAVIDRTREHLASERKRFDDSFLVDRLRGYHQARLADDPKAKTMSFPSGTLKARKAPDRVDIDEECFFAASPPADFVRLKREPNKTALLAHIKTTGEMPPGVDVVQGDIRFSVESAQ